MTSGFDCGNDGTYAAADEVTVEERRLLLLSSDLSSVPSTMPRNRMRPTWWFEMNFFAQSLGLSMFNE